MIVCGGPEPLRDCGNVAAEGGVVHLVEEDTEEGGGLFVQVWLELGVDLDDEGRSDGGEQTSLTCESECTHPGGPPGLRISRSC